MSLQILCRHSIPNQFQIQSISNLISEKVSVIFCFLKASKTMCFFDNTINLAGGVLFESKILVRLSSFGNQTFQIVIGNNSIIVKFEENTPTHDSLIQMESINNIKNLVEDDTEGERMKSLPFMILPPFIWKPVTEFEDWLPAVVLLIVLTRITDHFSAIKLIVNF